MRGVKFNQMRTAIINAGYWVHIQHIIDMLDSTERHYNRVLSISMAKTDTINCLEEDMDTLRDKIAELEKERASEWGTLKAARSDFRKEQDRKERSLTTRKNELRERELAFRDKSTPNEQRERFTQASEDTAVALNKLIALFAQAFNEPSEIRRTNRIIDETFEEGRRV